MRRPLRPDRSSRRGAADQSGVTLVITMALLLGVGVVVTSLIGITSDNILGSDSVQAQRGSQYALDAAATTELQLVRFDPSICSSGPEGISSLSPAVTAVCASSQVANPPPGKSQRRVVINVCPGTTCDAPSAALTVTAIFSDDALECPYGSGHTAECGEAEQILSWRYAGND